MLAIDHSGNVIPDRTEHGFQEKISYKQLEHRHVTICSNSTTVQICLSINWPNTVTFEMMLSHFQLKQIIHKISVELLTCKEPLGLNRLHGRNKHIG